jgi:hypothetical protein
MHAGIYLTHLSEADRLDGKVNSLCPASAIKPVSRRFNRRLNPLSILWCLPCGSLGLPLLSCLLSLFLPLLP